MSSNDESYMDCYEVTAAPGVTVKSTRMNEKDSWFFGMYPQDEKGTNTLVMVIILFLTPIIIMMVLWGVYKFFDKLKRGGDQVGGGRRR